MKPTNHIIHHPLSRWDGIVRDAEYTEEIHKPLMEYGELCIPSNPQPCGYKFFSFALKALKCDQNLSFSNFWSPTHMYFSVTSVPLAKRVVRK
jgi:hypothetical protein